MNEIAWLFSIFFQDMRGNGMQCACAEHHEPLRDDRALFELITLRGAQAGLAWRTVLAKRERYRQVFHDYDLPRIVVMTDDELVHIRLDRGIIRNRLKLASVRGNARATLRLVDAGSSLSALLWSFAEPGATAARPHGEHDFQPNRSDASDRMSAALRKRGFRFTGTAICYALMQSAGMLQSHAGGCPLRR